jgi:hypothetical protein
VSEAELTKRIEFAKWILDSAGPMWFAAEYDHKLRIQTAFFPSGVATRQDGLGTPASLNVLKQLEASADERLNWRPQGESNPRYRRERAMS